MLSIGGEGVWGISALTRTDEISLARTPGHCHNCHRQCCVVRSKQWRQQCLHSHVIKWPEVCHVGDEHGQMSQWMNDVPCPVDSSHCRTVHLTSDCWRLARRQASVSAEHSRPTTTTTGFTFQNYVNSKMHSASLCCCAVRFCLVRWVTNYCVNVCAHCRQQNWQTQLLPLSRTSNYATLTSHMAAVTSIRLMDYPFIRSRPEVETAETRLRDQRRRQISVNRQRRTVQHKRQLHFVFATTTTTTTAEPRRPLAFWAAWMMWWWQWLSIRAAMWRILQVCICYLTHLTHVRRHNLQHRHSINWDEWSIAPNETQKQTPTNNE